MNERETKTIEILRNIYDDISRWLVYAEAKHVALITISLFFLTQFFDNFELFFRLSPPIIIIILFGLACVTLVMSFFSFIPFLNHARFMKYFASCIYKKYHSKNGLFYLSVFLMEYREENGYENYIKMKWNINVLTPLEEDYIQQIKEVSQVVTIKNAIFKLEALFVLIICGLFCVMLIFIA